MQMFFNVKSPVEKLRAVEAITKAALDYYREVTKIVSELPKVDKDMDGQRAVDAREAKIAEYDLKKSMMLATAKAKIAPIEQDITAEIDAQTTPSGEMISDNPDFLLFDHNFIKSQDQLKRLIEKHAGDGSSILFAMSAESYAKAQGWDPEFDVFTDEGAVRDYTENVLEVCRKALDFPGGYFDAYASDAEFLEKLADAYGLTKSFSAQSGDFPEDATDDDSDSSDDDGGDGDGGSDSSAE